MDIRLSCIFISVVGGASLYQRREVVKPPCNGNDFDPPADTYNLDYYIPNIKQSIKAVKYRSESILKRMASNDCIDLSNTGLQVASFLDLSPIKTGSDNQTFLHHFRNNTSLFVKKMRVHYELLNELATYLEQLRNTSSIDDVSKTSLTALQEGIYHCMCSIKTALRSRNQDPKTSVPSGNLSDIFTHLQEHGFNRCDLQISEFITVSDTKRVVTYLDNIYSQ